MESEDALLAFDALSQGTRLAVFRLLVEHEPDGLSAGDIAARLMVPANTLSTHLGVLARAKIVTQERRSRQIIYRANIERIGSLVSFLADTYSAGRPNTDATPDLPIAGTREPGAPARIFNVLFLCTGNSARSIMAESILNKEGRGRFRAFSAGSHPTGDVHPLALKVLQSFDCPTDDLRSKSWNEFAHPNAPVMDFVFTVCDNASGEACPAWAGHPTTAHWGIADPAAAEGADADKQASFVSAFRYLRNRILPFLALPTASLDAAVLIERLSMIGRLEGATTKALKGPSKMGAFIPSDAQGKGHRSHPFGA
jgi:arsenate reductase